MLRIYNNIIKPEQFFFHSASDEYYQVHEHMTEDKLFNVVTSTVFYNIIKTFDKIWTVRLNFKLFQYNFLP